MYSNDITLDGDRPKQNKKLIPSKPRKRVQPVKKNNELKKQLLQLEYIEEILMIKFKVECSRRTYDDKLSIHGPGFILLVDEDCFFLYFEIELNILWAAELMKIFCFVINPVDIVTGKEFYYDSVNEQFYFNEEAKEIKRERDATKKGYIKCPYCERYFPVSKINKETMCCVLCEQMNMLKNIVFH